MAKRKKSTFERLHNGSLNRPQRKELERRFYAAQPDLEIVHPHAAGIDIGNESHFVAVGSGRDLRPVQEFGCWTADLRRMAAWLKGCEVKTVAMQSTGVYWIAVYEVLEKEGFEVYLVNARGTKNLPGRKSDVQECEWLRKLHTYGLLRKSFRPPEAIRAVRRLWRLRDRLVKDAGRTIQQIQKALTTMNVQLANAISDLSGVTGMAIVRAIVGGQRDPEELAKLGDRRIRASEEEIAHSLEGNWQTEVLFELKQVLEAHDFQQKQIAECDSELQKQLAEIPGREPVGGAPETSVPEKTKKQRKKFKAKRKSNDNRPNFDLGMELERLMGVELRILDGIDLMTVQTIYTEIGPDLSAFPTEKHFAAWLGLSPRREVSGGKVIRHERGGVKNRVANTLRNAAQTLSRSDSYLGARYRRLRARLGGLKAVKAMARYLACLIYRLLTKGSAWVDRGATYYEEQCAERELLALQRKASAKGLRLVPMA
jgi:transposase